MTLDEKMELLQKLKEEIDRESAEPVRFDGEHYKCSSCGSIVEKGQTYCPNCGQRMNWRFADDTIEMSDEIIFGGDTYLVEDILVDVYNDVRPKELTIKAKQKIFFDDWLM